MAQRRNATADGQDFKDVAMDFLQNAQASQWQELVRTPAVARYVQRLLIARVKRDRGLAAAVALCAITGSTPRTSWNPRGTLVEPVEPYFRTLGSARRVLEETPRKEDTYADVPKTPPDEEAPASPPRKLRRRLRFKQRGGSSLQLTSSRQTSLGGLNLDLAICVLGFLDVRAKLATLSCASTGLREALQQRAAWEPLEVDQALCRSLLRLLKERDPLGYFAEERQRVKSRFPRGFFEVRQLDIVLMDPERVEQPVSDTEDEAPRPLPALIPDPLDELLKRMKNYFPRAEEVIVRNIEDYRMDYRFVELRCGDLQAFGFVELAHLGVTYQLKAFRAHPPQQVDCQAVARLNLLRVRAAQVPLAPTTLSEREALFLLEHLSAFKNGDDFCLAHSVYRSVPSHTVRKKYKQVVDSLRRRFPKHFPENAKVN
ncbi:unnamed protein product [Effrenium voratum]|uniref:Uncharacterized protein n=1 Tax=Effrenium voratum TaxID=2562239 RepID=A0AA36HKI8_9DINO|nr:unnamed protein product [Effrenium voratum]